jgi:UDP-4-keto-D-FucNAc 4-reductase
MSASFIKNFPAQSMRIAVTGSGGFVGRSLCAHLRICGHAVIPISRQPASDDGFTRVVSSYTDVASLISQLTGVDCVIHLAARAHVRDEPDAARAYYEANVLATRGVIEACRLGRVRRLVYVSSIGVIGNRTEAQALTEMDEPAPQEPYAQSKLQAEREVIQTLETGVTDYVIIRPPLIYGPGCPGNFASLLSLATRFPIVPLGSITAPRSFIGIDNLVTALHTAAWHPAASRRVFVLADGTDINVAYIARIALEATGRSPGRLWAVPLGLLRLVAACVRKTATLAKLCAPLQIDARAFREATGWEPHVHPAEGIAQAARASALPD